MKYIDADKLRALLDEKWRKLADENVKVGGGKWDAEISTYLSVLRFIDSLRQEPTSDTDALHTKLINLLKTYRIGEETAITLAGRIADTYGAQRYMDGLCGGVKHDQPEVDLDFQSFAKEMDSIFALPKDMTGNTEENPLNWEHVIARHFYELGLKARMREPSRPADIDEAAEEWVRPVMRIPDKAHEYLYTYLLDAFKKGAEWMAGQGVNSEGKVFTSAFTSYVKTPGIEKLLKDAFPEDTEVIVQIRKK